MRIKGLVDEDFLQYKKPSMFVGFPYCSGKCWKELNLPSTICQNDSLRDSGCVNIDVRDLINRYENNPITKAIVFGGLEPFDSEEDLRCFLMNFRYNHIDDIVIYTGYTEEEVKEKFSWIFLYENIIIKFGRYIPNQKSHFDEVLGVELASNNQYAKIFN